MKLEREAKSKGAKQRIMFLRVLKMGEKRTAKSAAKLVGYCEIYGSILWKIYKMKGILGFGKMGKSTGRPIKLKNGHSQKILRLLENGELKTLKQPRQLLKEEFGVDYSSESSIWCVFQRIGITWKTGRPRHFKQDLKKVVNFKKTSQTK